MAKKKEESAATSRSLNKEHAKRPGRHAKKQHSLIKTSKNYKKPNVGQGK
jgi:hypothetical protein